MLILNDTTQAMRLPIEVTRNGRLLKGVLDKHELTLSGMLEEAGLTCREMRLWRWTQQICPCTDDDFAPFVPLVAKHERCGVDDVWQFLRAGHGKRNLHELLSFRFWPPTTAAMNELVSLVSTRLGPRARWIVVGSVVPLWLMDVGPRLRCLSALSKAAGVMGKENTEAWRAFHRGVHLHIMPRNKVVPLDGLVLTPESTFLACMRGEWPLCPSRPDHRAALSSGLAWDLALERGLIFGFPDDLSAKIADDLVKDVKEVECLLVINGNFLLRRRIGDRFWTTCERTGNSEEDRLFDEQTSFLKRVERSVGHPLDTETSFRMLARHVIDPAAPHQAIEEALQRLRAKPKTWQN